RSTMQDGGVSVLTKEAGKKKKEVTNATLVSGKSEQNQNLSAYREKLFMVANLVDSHNSKQAQKKIRLGNYMRQLAWLQFIIVISIIFYFLLIWGFGKPVKMLWATDLPMILGVILFGLLGSTVSAVLKITSITEVTKIPDLASTLKIMMLRLLMGSASALIMFVFIKSVFAGEIFKENVTESTYSIFAVSFAAGFTERLVRKAVESVASKEPVQ
ncbi:hypothetical protein LCGC14_2959860, partial [marine sediment metagenome]